MSDTCLNCSNDCSNNGPLRVPKNIYGCIDKIVRDKIRSHPGSNPEIDVNKMVSTLKTHSRDIFECFGNKKVCENLQLLIVKIIDRNLRMIAPHSLEMYISYIQGRVRSDSNCATFLPEPRDTVYVFKNGRSESLCLTYGLTPMPPNNIMDMKSKNILEYRARFKSFRDCMSLVDASKTEFIYMQNLAIRQNIIMYGFTANEKIITQNRMLSNKDNDKILSISGKSRYFHSNNVGSMVSVQYGKIGKTDYEYMMSRTDPPTERDDVILSFTTGTPVSIQAGCKWQLIENAKGEGCTFEKCVSSSDSCGKTKLLGVKWIKTETQSNKSTPLLVTTLTDAAGQFAASVSGLPEIILNSRQFENVKDSFDNETVVQVHSKNYVPAESSPEECLLFEKAYSENVQLEPIRNVLKHYLLKDKNHMINHE